MPSEVSVLNREPMGMKPYRCHTLTAVLSVSVLNREPMGMKHEHYDPGAGRQQRFSAQPRADGDEARRGRRSTPMALPFQCSTASRWG